MKKRSHTATGDMAIDETLKRDVRWNISGAEVYKIIIGSG